jgi:hypothetical protein
MFCTSLKLTWLYLLLSVKFSRSICTFISQLSFFIAGPAACQLAAYIFAMLWLRGGLFQFEGGKHPDPDMVGLMQRSFTYLLQQAESVSGNKVIRASYLEIYNEQVNLTPAYTSPSVGI